MEKLYTEQDQAKFDTSSVTFFIFKWRKTLFIITGAALLLSFVFSSSLFVTPKFRSDVIIFPSATSSISKSLLTDRSNQRTDLLDFGQESQTEQMLQILNSARIREKVVNRFDLMHHYGIKTDSRLKQTRLRKEYDRNVKFRRTEFMAVKISVLDKDPQMAADIANYISHLVDSVRNDIQREVAVPGFRIVEQQYLLLSEQIKRNEDSLKRLRELGVHEYESQSEMLNQQLAIEIARGNKTAIHALENKLSTLSKYGGAYVSLKDELSYERRLLSQLKTRYDEARVDAEQFMPFKFIVEPAIKAERESYPVRWLIMLTSTLGALIISIITLLFLENFRAINLELARKRKNSATECMLN